MKFSLNHNRIYTFIIALFIPFSIYQITQSSIEWYVIVGVALLVYFYTDILSGILHIVLDNERSLDIPIVESLARGFQSHHRNPTDIYTMSWYNHLYTMHLPIAAVFPIVALIDHPLSYLIYLYFAISLHLMQMSHRWAHLPLGKVPKAIYLLQKSGFILSRKEHGKHHNTVYDTNFCIMNGWFNPFLNFLVRTFGRTSHGWLVIFLGGSLLILFLPVLLQL